MTNEIKDIRNTLLKIQSTLDRFTTFFGSFNKTPESTTIPASDFINKIAINTNKHDLTTGTITGDVGPFVKLGAPASRSICSISEVSEIYTLNKMGQCGVSPSDLAKTSKNTKEK